MTIAADEPQTDRELLLQIHHDVNHLKTKISGSGGLCDEIHLHDQRIASLENWRWYILGAFAAFTFLLVFVGRLIEFGVVG